MELDNFILKLEVAFQGNLITGMNIQTRDIATKHST